MADYSDEPAARVTMLMLYKEQRETKDILIELRADMHNSKAVQADQEERIRALEQFRWTLGGIALVVSVVVEFVAKTLFK
jgi:hypothetical protein